MHIKAKLYPYPVLADFNDDYVDSSFNILISIQNLQSKIVCNFLPNLNNEDIYNLINNKLAKFVIHIESSLTSYRQLEEIPLEGKEVEISADKLDGLITFCPFIIATEDIKNYSNSKFNKIYDGITFDLEKCSIIAVGKEAQIRLEKEDDDLASVPSIFAVTEIKDKDKNEIIIDINGNKINIQLPSDTFLEFKIAMNNPKSMAIIHSMVIIPALMKCFDDMKSKPEDLYLYENRRWFRALKKALKNINVEISEDNILSINSFEVSQKLMENTTNRAILSINEIAHRGDITDD